MKVLENAQRLFTHGRVRGHPNAAACGAWLQKTMKKHEVDVKKQGSGRAKDEAISEKC